MRSSMKKVRFVAVAAALVATAVGGLAPVVGADPAAVMRPMLWVFCSVNHSAPSGPAAIPKAFVPAVGMSCSVIAPAVVMRPILLAACSVNHIAPSEPTAMSSGLLGWLGVLNSLVTTPAVVIRPTAFRAPASVNHNAPSGPATMPCGRLSAVARSVSVIDPVVVMRPIRLPNSSVNHNAPSGPAVM